MRELASWENFNVIVGTSAGALIGLQFILMSLLANQPQTRAADASAAFGTPTVVHFSVVLFLSAIGTMAWTNTTGLLVLWAAVSFFGMIYTLRTIRHMISQRTYQPVLEDWIFHALLPFVSYLFMAVAAVTIYFWGMQAAFFGASAMLTLLFTGVHNSWDAVTYAVLIQTKERIDPVSKKVSSERGIQRERRDQMKNVTVLIGAGSIGLAIARRVSSGNHIVVADLKKENGDAVAKTLEEAGFETSVEVVNVSSRDDIERLAKKAQSLGEITHLIQAAGVSPSQAPISAILHVDLYGTAVILEVFGKIMARGGSGVVIASQSGHRLGALTDEQNKQLALTPADELLRLPMLQEGQVKDTLHAYQLSKRGNSLRVMAEAVKWAKRGARLNTISPGIIMTPLANDELSGPRGEGYRKMISGSPVGRVGTPDECANVAALLMGPEGAFITGSDVLMDGGVTSSYFFGALAP